MAEIEFAAGTEFEFQALMDSAAKSTLRKAAQVHPLPVVHADTDDIHRVAGPADDQSAYWWS